MYRAAVNDTCERSGASFLSLSTFKADGEVACGVVPPL